MAEKKKSRATVTSQVMLSEGIYSMWLKFPKEQDVAATAVPGQFISMYCNEGSRLLPRPISICEINKEERMLRVVYRIAGNGTQEFSKLLPGDTLDVVGPLGNGFTLKEGRSILIGGGIGIPPMLELAKSLPGEVTVVLGYRNDDLFLKEEFAPYAEVFVSTEDGSAGTKGNVIDAVKANQLTADTIYACGPTPMLRGVKEFALSNEIDAQVSMEEKMACGIGACLACVCQSKEKDSHSNVNNKRVCKDGPVFDVREIEL
ncbi:MAG: dihydroorotate dehydrogenase electron transfer subunit [Butyribacter sp.]|nr:dihydroorotate dehydrogenase electron transfer subunit [bacterium]MDY3853597.1 dihydroorotate dehydrogenase electron transfer subunit [Butyribacter sp.]